MHAKLPISAWGHAILHVVVVVHLRPTAYHQYSPTQIVLSQQPNISYLRLFCCVVYVPILPPHCMKMSLQCRLGIYVSFNLSLIIRYLEPLTGDLFTICFANCYIES